MAQTSLLHHRLFGCGALAHAALACSSSSAPSPTVSPPSGQGDAGPETPPAESSAGLVVAFYDEARAAGVDVIAEGGSAADAFVAVTLVDYVRAPGFTSLGGPLAALTYDATTGEIATLDATFDSVHDPSGLYDPLSPKLGASVLVPGALRGLEALWKRFGKLPWARLVQPARRLAAEGFSVDTLYAASIASRIDTLTRTTYGSSTFVPGGAPLAKGALLQQPELASFLADVANEGASAMYEGAFAQQFVQAINSNGGAATLADLDGYEARWLSPWSLEFAGATVYANSGRMYGGLYTLLGLSVLTHDAREATTLDEVDRLDVRIRAARALYEDPWFFGATKLDDPAFVEGKIATTDSIWASVAAGLAAEPQASSGSHSLHVTVIDGAGNAVTGTNTINALAWGSGLFVRGVALSDAGTTTMFVPGPGQRVVNALSLHIAKRDEHLVFVGGTFGSSLCETELQVVADAVGERLAASAVVDRHRFGTFPFDFAHPEDGLDTTANWLDPATSDELVTTLTERGLSLVRDPYGDWGWGTFAVAEGDGRFHAGVLDYEWFRGGSSEVE